MSTRHRVAVVIPARFASQRFPGKPLANETGKTLVQHVYEQAQRSTYAGDVLVAADDERIADAVRAFGGIVRMTRTDHPNGTSRIAEVAGDLDVDLIVNVQGDEPELEPALIDAAVGALIADPGCPMGTVASTFAAGEDPRDPNIVKVVLDQRGRAMYFSRACIPHDRDGIGARVYKHVGLYVYRREFLSTYVDLPPTPLERAECLEQLRVLEHGFGIAVAIGEAHHHGIDTPEQYAAFVARWRAAQ